MKDARRGKPVSDQLRHAFEAKQASDRSQPALLLSPLTASQRVPPLLSCHRDSKTRHCEGCDADFRPARPWSRFCGPARRLSAPIAALFTLGKILDHRI